MEVKTTHTETWKFEEMTEDQKQRAIAANYDINVGYIEWWEQVYYDAEQVGIKITGFDIDRGAFCEGDISDVKYTADEIIDTHGNDCETYKTAADYLKERAKLVLKWSDGINLDIVAADNEYDFDEECNDLDEDFKKSILEDYRIMLQKEYEYLTSEYCISDTLIANDYDLTDSGEIY